MCYLYNNRSKNNKPLDSASISDELSGDTPTSTLTLQSVAPEDTGTYKCVSQAAASQATWSTFCYLRVFGKFN